MKKIILSLLLPFISHCPFSHAAASSILCNNNAIEDARKLLSFYRANDDRIQISGKIKPLAKIKNPANKTQSFDVLEVWGYLYKGQYRMRLIYSTESGCLLMGEEILEYADL
ncbi:hypothetical protein [Scandinavium goeteborgense]|uniref:Uncharacterized protein n=1 Tax=Scandinavium goeteborgense TaxID=1851514 RepID=A0A4R6EEA1_SCAGO|nr:hypothetical protein [Scandinavium goeteborgense]TDN56572.1 hypothetical protein EC847_11077 [Scandinavium goeteborgense]